MSSVSRWELGKSAAVGQRGVVASKTREAPAAGAAVLARGGNAVDAAVATAFVSWVAEPWKTGLGGGGYLVIHRPGTSPVVIDATMVAPGAASAEMFPLAARSAEASLFGWAPVVGGANTHGATSVAVPGNLAGLALALERFGTISLAEALEPAIALAETGAPVTWLWSQITTSELATLALDPGASAIYLDANGHPPVSGRLRNPDLARTLRLIADQGPGAFYEGEIAASIVAHLREQGSSISLADFAGYRAHVTEPILSDFHGHQLVTTSGPGGGPTLTEAMRLLAGFDLRSLGAGTPEALHLIAESLKIAFADRFAYFGDPTQIEAPFEALLSAAYLDERRAGLDPDRASRPRAGDRATLGVTHSLAASIPDYTNGGSTSHLSVMDASGMTVASTHTLLGHWGSRVVAPGTGVLLNNGMMWFDPEPGRPNSIGPGKRPVANMSPALLLRNGEAVAALGASGGRRIIAAVAQMAINLIDFDLDIQAATSAPRLDASTPRVLISDRFGAPTIDAMIAKGHPVSVIDDTLLGGEFSSPANAWRAPDGSFVGGVDPFYFPATAVGIDR